MFDEEAIDEMAQSITAHGIIQPIIVTPLTNRTYQIVAGERRFRGAQKAGIMKIPALVRTLTDQHKLELSLIENLQRRDLNVLETATAYLKLRDQFNMSLEDIGTRVGGKSVSAVSNTLRLLRLPESVKRALHEGKLREGQARPLVNVDSEVIEAILPQILKEEWSARRIEQYIVDLKNSSKEKTTNQPDQPSSYQQAGLDLSKRFSAKVQVRSNTRGAGQIVISFRNDKDFERISHLLGE